MVNGVWVGLLQPSDPFVFLQDRPKRIARSYTLKSQGRDPFELLLCEHWHLRSASPAPQNLHGTRIAKAGFPVIFHRLLFGNIPIIRLFGSSLSQSFILSYSDDEEQ
jgi:hypothetical protein